MATANKVKYGLNNVYYAIITGYDEDELPEYSAPVRFPGAVSLSLSAEGSNDPFYADNCVYYMCASNSGYSGDFEAALIPTSFASDVLGEELDSDGVLVEHDDAEVVEFALLFEFDGDKNHIRHVMYRCSATRASVESNTTEDTRTPQTETLTLTAAALSNGVVKAKTCEETSSTVYDGWFSSVYSAPLTV